MIRNISREMKKQEEHNAPPKKLLYDHLSIVVHIQDSVFSNLKFLHDIPIAFAVVCEVENDSSLAVIGIA